jgi:TusA-related sulfurtransferase
MIKIDASGLSCPEPMILLKKGLMNNVEVVLVVDNKTSVETCSRFAQSKGYSVDVKSNDGIHEITVKKG